MLRIRPAEGMASRVAVGAAVPVLVAGAVTPVVIPQSRPVAHAHLRLFQPVLPAGRAGTPAATTGSTFQMAASRHYGQPANASGFAVILATGPDQAWAFGGTNPGGPSAPVAAQWNGTEMTAAPLPSGLSSFISDASATSASDVWAASQYGRYVLHYDGSQWRVARRWPHGQITGVTAVSPANVWVFGTTAAGTSQLGTWHYDGTAWQKVPGLAGSIYRASAVSATDIWAIAASPASYSILRFDGETWQPVPAGSLLDGVQPRDILAISARDVWVLGNQANASGGVRLVLLHWDGTRWARLVTQLNAWAGRLTADSDHSVLMTATPATTSAAGMVLQAWATTGRPAVRLQSWLDSGGVSDVAVATPGHALWASGAVLTGLGGDAVIWTGQPGHSTEPAGSGA